MIETCKQCGLSYYTTVTPHECAEWTKGTAKPVESIACFNGAHDSCRNDDCPCKCGHGFRNLLRHMEVVVDVDRAITATNEEYRRVATMACVIAAILDVIDEGDPKGFDGWLFYKTETERQTQCRARFTDAVKARIAVLQSPPHSMDARLLEELRRGRGER